MDINNFHAILGQTIMYCQIIENDIKLIYSAMLKGNMDDTFSKIKKEKWTLGKTISELEQLDNSDGDSYFGNEDYKLLKQITKKRNHWCHETYIVFVYTENFGYSKEYQKECFQLNKDHDQLAELYKIVENVRLKAMKDFNRI